MCAFSIKYAFVEGTLVYYLGDFVVSKLLLGDVNFAFLIRFFMEGRNCLALNYNERGDVNNRLIF